MLWTGFRSRKVVKKISKRLTHRKSKYFEWKQFRELKKQLQTYDQTYYKKYEPWRSQFKIIIQKLTNLGNKLENERKLYITNFFLSYWKHKVQKLHTKWEKCQWQREEVSNQKQKLKELQEHNRFKADRMKEHTSTDIEKDKTLTNN